MVAARTSAIAVVLRTGRFDHVRVLSLHAFDVPWTPGPSTEPLVTKTRSLAFRTVPVSPDTVKRR